MRVIAWLIGVCLMLAGLLLGLLAAVGYSTSTGTIPNEHWYAIGIGVFALFVLGTGARLVRWAKRAGEATLAAFNRLRIGDGRNRCIDLLGENGRQVSSGAEAIQGKVVDRMQCFWDNADGSYAEVIFENDVVVAKSQFGLR